MKSNHINTAARFTGLVAALLLLGGAASMARADVTAKGGATLLMRPTAPVSHPWIPSRCHAACARTK